VGQLGFYDLDKRLFTGGCLRRDAESAKVHRLRHQSNTTAPIARSGGAPNSQIVVLFEIP
jgi:hypothetical protein